MQWQIRDADGRTVIYDAAGIPSSGAPVNAPYVTLTPDSGLSAEFALSTLAAGVLYNNPGGNPSIATQVQLARPPALLRELQTVNVGGGSAAAATWNNRITPKLKYDPLGLLTLNANGWQFNVVGNYWIIANAVAYKVNAHRLRVYNQTLGAAAEDINGDVVYGSSAFSNSADAVTSTSEISQSLEVISAAHTYRLQHYTQSAFATNGLGVPVNIAAEELYASIYLWLMP